MTSSSKTRIAEFGSESH